MASFLTKSLLVALGAFGAATLARAQTLTINTNSFSDSFGGGEFTITSSTLSNASYSLLARGSGGSGFESFCLEYNEHFTPGGTYAYSLSNAAFGGDLPAGFDTISVGVAWLYQQFATGTLAGYNYSSGASLRAASALELQLAIWYLEDETSLSTFISDHGAYNPGSSNQFLNAAFSHFGSEAAARADNAPGGYNFYVANLTSNQGRTNNQSQTYYRVPDMGSSALLAGLPIALMIVCQRKRRVAGR